MTFFVNRVYIRSLNQRLLDNNISKYLADYTPKEKIKMIKNINVYQENILIQTSVKFIR